MSIEPVRQKQDPKREATQGDFVFSHFVASGLLSILRIFGILWGPRFFKGCSYVTTERIPWIGIIILVDGKSHRSEGDEIAFLHFLGLLIKPNGFEF